MGDWRGIALRKGVLVIGSNLAGVRAALDLAQSGIHVYLVEGSPFLGHGNEGQVSPHLLTAEMLEAVKHSNIEILTDARVTDLAGRRGDFQVEVQRAPRYVDLTKCTACGDCAKACPVLMPDEFEMGLGSRKAIFIPFPQAVPSAYVLNPFDCLGQDPLICGKCKEACEKGCIDYDAQHQELTLKVGTFIVPTGDTT